MTDDDDYEKVTQCKSCPWRVDCQPMEDIPNYIPDLHHKLDRTIKSGLETLGCKVMHVMACHYSKPGKEFPCAGWLHNQIGPGNNIGVRLRVMTKQMPVPVVDGKQYETFEETLCNTPGPSETSTASSTNSRKTGAAARTKRSAAKPGGRRTPATKRSRA